VTRPGRVSMAVMTDTSMNGMFEPAQVTEAIDYELNGAEVTEEPVEEPEPEEETEG
jgi:hypothetical protein